jgi:ABC-type spermidine/putrescine transport system permease subunit II
MADTTHNPQQMEDLTQAIATLLPAITQLEETLRSMDKEALARQQQMVEALDRIAAALESLPERQDRVMTALSKQTRSTQVICCSVSAAVRTVHPEMEEAVRILGGGRMRAIRSVVAPLMKKSLFGAWLIVFIIATRELSAAVFLVGPNTRTMSVMLYDLSEEGNFEVLSALGGILLVITLALVAIGIRLLGRDFMLRRS